MLQQKRRLSSAGRTSALKVSCNPPLRAGRGLYKPRGLPRVDQPFWPPRCRGVFNKIEKFAAQEVLIQRHDFSTSRRSTLDQPHDARGDCLHDVLIFVGVIVEIIDVRDATIAVVLNSIHRGATKAELGDVVPKVRRRSWGVARSAPSLGRLRALRRRGRGWDRHVGRETRSRDRRRHSARPVGPAPAPAARSGALARSWCPATE